MKPSLRNLFLSLALLTASLPILQKILLYVHEKPLNGFYMTQPEPELKFFTWQRWFNGEFQEQFVARIKDHVGLRNSLIRLNNEIDFRFFRITHAEGFIRGIDDNLFEEDYIFEYTGEYFIGERTWNRKLQKLAEVKNHLSELGTELILVIEPGKASCFPEFIPEKYLKHGLSLSNYTYLTQWMTANRIPCLDLNNLFISIKDTASTPLFTKYGMHWSLSSLPFVVDTLSRFIESVTKRRVPTLTIQRHEVSDTLRWTDKDIADLFNLCFPLPTEPIAYPIVGPDTSGVLPELKVLVIADSYYQNISVEYSKLIFASEEFWYYNSKLYPHIVDNRNPVYADKSNLKEKLPQFDIILLMSSEINLHSGFWNFADEVYQAFYPHYKDPPWYPYQNSILTNRTWFRHVVSTAKGREIPLEDMIIGHARYFFNTKNR